MSNNSMNTIDAAALETTRTKVLRDIKKTRRAVDAMRTIADHFNGVYCTRRLLPQLTALFPSASHTYMSDPDYGGNIYLSIHYGSTYFPENTDEIFLCKAENRRIDGDAMRKAAERDAIRAGEKEEDLQRLDEVVAAYNAVAAEYAEIYEDMRTWFSEIPYADYQLSTQAATRRKETNAISLGLFARKYA